MGAKPIKINITGLKKLGDKMKKMALLAKVTSNPTDDTKAEYLKSYRDIDKIVWNNPAVIVILKTGEKGVAKVQPGDIWNCELGFWVAYTKALQEKDKPFRRLLQAIKNCMELVNLAQKFNQEKRTQFPKGGLCKVGEQGPELVLPPQQQANFIRSGFLNLSGLPKDYLK